MNIGFIGLGKMGNQMVARLLEDGHEVVVRDVDQAAVEAAVGLGATAAPERQDMIAALDPVVIWLMIPAPYVDDEIAALAELLPAGSIVVDGGNSDFRLSVQRAEQLQQKQIAFVDVGTSGGVLGKEQGFSMMVGGDDAAVKVVWPVLQSLAQPEGLVHVGTSGSGHYTKMVHNAAEYGLMEAYAEGYRMLKDGPFADIDLAAVGSVWRHGSIISSLLNDLTVEILQENPELAGIDGYVAESGEARWTLEAARDLGITLPAVQVALDVRKQSQRGEVSFATKLLAAMRNKFGGHSINQ